LLSRSRAVQFSLSLLALSPTMIRAPRERGAHNGSECGVVIDATAAWLTAARAPARPTDGPPGRPTDQPPLLCIVISFSKYYHPNTSTLCVCNHSRHLSLCRARFAHIASASTHVFAAGTQQLNNAPKRPLRLFVCLSK
jgi:hypothetical protein